MENIKKKGVVEKMLSTILKHESFELTMRHQKLIKAERKKDGKSFIVFKIDQSKLIPKVNALQTLGLFSSVKRVFGCSEYSYAELTVPENSFTLAGLMELNIEITEAQLGGLMSKIIKVKEKLLKEKLDILFIRQELIFLEPKGKLVIVPIDVSEEQELFKDIISTFKLLMHKRVTRNKADEGTLSRSLIDLIQLMDKLGGLAYKGSFEDMHPKYKEIWDKIVTHPFIKQKFQRQSLAEYYQSGNEQITELGIERLAFKKSPSEQIMIDRICWKGEAEGKARIPARGLTETSDSSGGSSSQALHTTVENPANGSQEWKTLRDKQNSQIFLASCQEVMESTIAKTRRECPSSFLVSALENLLQTLKACEEIHPCMTEQILEELVQQKK